MNWRNIKFFQINIERNMDLLLKWKMTTKLNTMKCGFNKLVKFPPDYSNKY